MVGNKLILLKQEIVYYIGLPYSKNVLKDGKVVKEQFLGGKGNYRQIATETIKLAQNQNVDLVSLDNQSFYNFQKKNHIGIDCSGLACQLLNFYFEANLNLRKTSADMLTSSPISKKIKPNEIKTGDLIRQQNGHHVLFIIEKQGNTISYVDSSLEGRGVNYGSTDITDKSFKNDGFYRLLLLD